MNARTLSPSQTPHLLLEAMRRVPRRGTSGARRQTGDKGGTPSQISHNNYLAEQSAGHGPNWGKNCRGAGLPRRLVRRSSKSEGGSRKAKAGAPPGNSNAYKHGLASAEVKARRAKVRSIVRHARQAIALAYAMAAADIAAIAASAEKGTTRAAAGVIPHHQSSPRSGGDCHVEARLAR